jgi:hypothetical protein
MVDFVVWLMKAGSPAVRQHFGEIMNWERWKFVGCTDDYAAQWLLATKEILVDNPPIVGIFQDVGIVDLVLQLTGTGPFDVRKLAIAMFAEFAQLLPVELLGEIVAGDLIDHIADFAPEFAGEEAMHIIDFLRFVLEAEVRAGAPQLLGRIMASNLAHEIQMMAFADDIALSDKAGDFCDEFFGEPEQPA